MRAIEVSRERRSTGLVVLGNAIQLEQVFINLLTNARDALADADRREVHIASMEEGDTVKITLADTGTGIPPGIEQRIFDPFYDEGGRRRHRSRPVDHLQHRQGARRRDLGRRPAWGGRGLLHRAAASRGGGDRGRRGVSEVRILIVDDDEALLACRRPMRMNGILIDTSPSAQTALELIRRRRLRRRRQRYQAPGMDGLALLTEINELRPGTPTPLITATASTICGTGAARRRLRLRPETDRPRLLRRLARRAVRMRRLDRQVHQQRVEARAARVLQHVDRGVFLVDETGIVRYWNPAAQAITGLEAGNIIGGRAADVIPRWDAIGPEVPIATEPGPGSFPRRRSHSRSTAASFDPDLGVEFEDGIVYAFRNLTEERALDVLKSDFIATVSHELRTRSRRSTAARGRRSGATQLGDEDRARLLEVVAQESERLTRIVGDILLASQIDAGRLRLKGRSRHRRGREDGR